MDKPDDDPTAAQIRAQAQFRQARPVTDNRRPGLPPLFWKGVACGLPLTAAIWLVLWLVIFY